MDREKRYEIRVNEEQIAVLQDALESYFRVRMGQFRDLADDVAFSGFDYKDHEEIEFSTRIARRNAGLELLLEAFRILQPRLTAQTGEMLTAQDMWAVIRHERWKERPDRDKLQWTTDAHEPLHLSGEPMIQIRRAEDG